MSRKRKEYRENKNIRSLLRRLDMFQLDKKAIFKRFLDVVFGAVIGMLLAADIIFARSIDMSKAGVSLWIFVAVGAFIILLQLIPAFILFTTFIGYFSKKIHNSIPVKQDQTDFEASKKIAN
jgi:hypothetical protein